MRPEAAPPEVLRASRRAWPATALAAAQADSHVSAEKSGRGAAAASQQTCVMRSEQLEIAA